ncbi:MAG: YwaF family protein [Oscillospiraceae bacterium]|nr:YwaF family protein [Oscillospiraceae bacterium]
MHMIGALLELLNAKMDVPEMYGWFHVFFFVLSIFAGIVLCRRCPKPDEAFIRKLLLIISLTVMALEVYKQINFSFRYDGETISFDYQWYAFPFQFCSTPMYIGLLSAVARNRHLHECLCAYLATYGFFAGLCVMFYPSTVFIDTIGINIQTMICHGSMVTIGIYLLFSGYVQQKAATIRKALPVFAILAAMAMGMNELAYRTGLLETETFNMFFISPYCAPELPVYSLVQGFIPFPWCLLFYVAGFTAAGALVLCLVRLLSIFLFHSCCKTSIPVKQM